MKKIFLLIIILFVSFGAVKADHLVGGEITWKCLKTGPDVGKFVFRMVLYRDCAGAGAPTSATLTTVNGCPVGSISLSSISSLDVSPVCNSSGCTGQSTLTCASATSTTIGATQEVIMESAPVAISGIPPATGWLFKYESCCTPNYMTNVAWYQPFVLRAIMFPYNGQNTYPCFDSSPQFIERAATALNIGYPFTYNHNASDEELDSLSFSWVQPAESYSGMTPNVSPWEPGYSTLSQLPSPTQNVNNVAATLDSSTGEIAFTSYTSGKFATSIKVKAFKCGQLLAEIYRDLEIILMTPPAAYPGAPPNQPPLVNKPFYGGTRYDTLVYAGDSVCFNILAEDYDEKCALVFQNVTIQASGSQFGTGYSNTTAGCLNPPCATLTPPPGDPLVTNVQNGASSRFCWQTECVHVGFVANVGSGGCIPATSTYLFIVRIYDDFCPAPGLNMLTVKVVVKDKPKIKAPDFHCTEVLSSGNVKLMWTPVVDTVESFKNYLIWRSPNKYGPYTNIATYNSSQINASNYTDPVNANLAPYYYYMQTVSGCYSDTLTSDTLSTIFLDVNALADPDGFLGSMTWNSVSAPNLPTNLGMYYIYRSVASGPFVLVDSTYNPTDTALNFIDASSLAVCYDNVTYRIEVVDATGCRSISNVSSDIVGQQTPPDQPVISTATVLNTTGDVVINWVPNTDTDLSTYTILYSNNPSGGPFNVAGTVTLPAPASYIHNNPLVNSQPQYYFVFATDTCGYVGDTSLSHVTIYLEDTLDKCEGRIELAWNNYLNWDGGVDHYEVHLSENAGPYNLYSSSSSLEELITNLNVGSDYCMYIQAFGAGASAGLTVSSNIVCLTADLPNFPQFVHIRSASVNEDKSIKLTVHVDATAQLQGYNIYRSNTTSDFDKIAEVLPSPSPLVYIDNDVMGSTDKKSFYYKVAAVGICGTEVLTSNITRTIHLATAADDNYIYNNIYWNEYEGWPTGVDYYNLYRSTSEDETPVLIASLPSDVLSYHDDISEMTSVSGEFCYTIEAVENNGNPYSFKDTSHSNEFCVIQHPTIFVPSAFNPSGINKEFVPVTTYLELDNYEFRVFNRWGQEVFATRNINEGWTGVGADAGVYVYLVKFTSTQGVKIEKRGTVTLLN
jgi:hypothetical protein